MLYLCLPLIAAVKLLVRFPAWQRATPAAAYNTCIPGLATHAVSMRPLK